MTQSRMFWTLVVSVVFVFSASYVYAGSAPATGGTWVLEPAWACMTGPCARFFPTAGGPPIDQGKVFRRTLPAPGELRLPKGKFKLVFRSHGGEHRYLFYGPASITLNPGGHLCNGPCFGDYEHGQGSPDEGLEMGVPPLVAGPEGTRLSFLTTLRGTVMVKVDDGAAVVRWMLEPGGEAVRIGPGEAVELEVTPPMVGTRSLEHPQPPSQTGTLQELEGARENDATAASSQIGATVGSPEEAVGSAAPSPRPAALPNLRKLTGDEVEPEYRRLVSEPQAEEVRGQANAAGAFAGFSIILATGSTGDAAQAALELAASYPAEPTAARALYLAWLKARATGLSDQAEQLARTLRELAPESIWAGLLEAPAGTPAQPAAPGEPHR